MHPNEAMAKQGPKLNYTADTNAIKPNQSPAWEQLELLSDALMRLTQNTETLESRLSSVVSDSYESPKDGNNPEPVRSALVSNLASHTRQINAINDRVVSLMGRIEV